MQLNPLDDRDERQRRADDRIAQLICAILDAEAPAADAVDAAVALLSITRVIAKQVGLADRFKIAIAARRTSFQILKILVWN